MQIKGETSINKLIILFVFDQMGTPLSDKVLLDICTSSNDWVTYMDCVTLIQRLVEDGFLVQKEGGDANETIYSITPDGSDSLANFYINIPKSTRERIVAFIKANKERYRMKQEYLSDYYQNGDGSYTVHLRILSPSQPILQLKFVIPDKKTAQNIYRKWPDKAGDIYTAIYEGLVD